MLSEIKKKLIKIASWVPVSAWTIYKSHGKVSFLFIYVTLSLTPTEQIKIAVCFMLLLCTQWQMPRKCLSCLTGIILSEFIFACCMPRTFASAYRFLTTKRLRWFLPWNKPGNFKFSDYLWSETHATNIKLYSYWITLNSTSINMFIQTVSYYGSKNIMRAISRTEPLKSVSLMAPFNYNPTHEHISLCKSTHGKNFKPRKHRQNS